MTMGSLLYSFGNFFSYKKIVENKFNYVNKKYELLGGSENETDIFYLVVTDFIANGGDGYNELKTLKKIEVNEPVQNATIQYINSLPKDGELGKIVQPNTQTRIIQ